MHRKIRAGVVASLTALLLGVGPARADVFSPAIINDPLNGRDTLICSVLNTKPKPVHDVTIEIVKGDGVVVTSAGPLTLHPFDDRTLFIESGVTIAYCRARGRLSKKKTIISICGAQSFADECETLVSAP